MQEISLTDEELEKIDAIGGLCVGHPGLGLGLGNGFGFGGGFGGFGGGFGLPLGYGYGSQVVVAQPQVVVAQPQVVEQVPVTETVQASCGTQLTATC
jgi:hypothetical protein